MPSRLAVAALFAFAVICLACTSGKKAPAPVAQQESDRTEPKQDKAAPPASGNKPYHPTDAQVDPEPKPAQDPKPDNPPPMPVKQAPVQCAGFGTLNMAYQQNAPAADITYQGKLVAIAEWSFGSEVKKVENGYVLIGVVGQGQRGNVLYTVFGVGCNLSADGAKQYAALKKDEAIHLKLAGTVRGTKPYPDNLFGGFMVILDDCYFTNEFGDPEVERQERLAKNKEEAAKKLAEEKMKMPMVTAQLKWADVFVVGREQVDALRKVSAAGAIEIAGPISKIEGTTVTFGASGDNRSNRLRAQFKFSDEITSLRVGQTIHVVGKLSFGVAGGEKKPPFVGSATLAEARLLKAE